MRWLAAASGAPPAAATLVVDDLCIQVRWSTRRRTIELSVLRDGAVVIHAPAGVRRAVLERVVREKRDWVRRKVAQQMRRAQAATRAYAPGERLPYLGRSYPLVLVDEQDAPLKLSAGRFRLRRADAERAREHFVCWYLAHAAPWVRRRVEVLAPLVGVRPREVLIRDLGRRWGSCTHQTGRVRLHWAAILLPPDMIDYLLVHELAHLIEPNHGPRFWAQVERVLPDYRELKARLAREGLENLL